MPNFALVKQDGTVAAVYTGPEDAYMDGNEYGEQTARGLPENVNPDEVLDCWRWENGWIVQDTPTQNLDVQVVAIAPPVVIE